MQNDWWAREKKRNMTALKNQFKVKFDLEQGEFESGVCKFFKVNVLAKHKNITCNKNSKTFFLGEDCSKGRHFLLVEIVLNGDIFCWWRLY